MYGFCPCVALEIIITLAWKIPVFFVLFRRRRREIRVSISASHKKAPNFLTRSSSQFTMFQFTIQISFQDGVQAMSDYFSFVIFQRILQHFLLFFYLFPSALAWEVNCCSWVSWISNWNCNCRISYIILLLPLDILWIIKQNYQYWTTGVWLFAAKVLQIRFNLIYSYTIIATHI
jgi:hypothetical protein